MVRSTMNALGTLFGLISSSFIALDVHGFHQIRLFHPIRSQIQSFQTISALSLVNNIDGDSTYDTETFIDDSSWGMESENDDVDDLLIFLNRDEDEDMADEDPSIPDASEHSLLEEYENWKDALEKCISALTKKQTSLQSELKKAEQVGEAVQRAELITSNMYLFTPGVRTATVNDWNRDGEEVELTLDNAHSSASEEADALFQKARKLKRGSQVILPLLQEVEDAVRTLNEIQADFISAGPGGEDEINENVLRLLQDRLLRSSAKTGFQEPSEAGSALGAPTLQQQPNQGKQRSALGSPASNLRKFVSPGGCVVLVGRNRKGNEYLTFNVARGNDVWMHARGCPGAHVLIQQRRGNPPATEACLQFAANLAIFYSDGRSEKSFDVTTSEPKHLLKPRGAPLGAVKIRQESGTLVGRPDNVPDECKEARDASGQDTAYRFHDKAKHRKQTRQAAKEQQDKRRAELQSKKRKRDKPQD